MKARAHAAVVTLIASVLSLVAIAGSTPACAPSKCGRQCPADPEPTDREVARCESGVAPVTACQAQYNALAECSVGKTVCNSADQTDEAGTDAVIVRDCPNQLRAYTDCTSKQPL